jgi:uncharacterized membrane protein YhaH (DUF805 family)
VREFLSRFLKGPFNFNGRVGRGRYWRLTLLYLLAFMLGSALFITLGIVIHASPNDPVSFVAVIVFMVFMFATSIAIASIGVRRLHDRGKPGWWLLLYYAGPLWLVPKNSAWHGAGLILPVIALAILLRGFVDLGVLRGESGPNAYGPDPLMGPS